MNYMTEIGNHVNDSVANKYSKAVQFINFTHRLIVVPDILLLPLFPDCPDRPERPEFPLLPDLPLLPGGPDLLLSLVIYYRAVSLTIIT